MINIDNNIEKTITYFDVIYALIRSPFQLTSLLKLVYLSLSINNLFDIKTFSNRKQNMAKELLSNLSNISNDIENELSIVLEIIDKLKRSNVICIRNDQIKLIKNIECQRFSSFLNMNQSINIISERCRLSNLSFMEEVIKYV